MHRIENLLRKEIGLDAASIGHSAIGRTVRLRMKNIGLNNVADYARLLHSSRAELDELIEAVVVIETWFFRDRDPFSAFVALAIEWLEQQAANAEKLKAESRNQFPLSAFPISALPRLRVLSVPCSTGEEAYSLAMALLDANAPPDRFMINAVDVSANALARAKKGVYGKNSFRGKELAFRDRHFHHTQDGHVLNPRVPREIAGVATGAAERWVISRGVRECVQFLRDNVLSDKFLLGHTPYDFIFCRNLLIYFDRDTQVRALERLHRLLSPEGVLFVGPAELPIVLWPSPPSENAETLNAEKLKPDFSLSAFQHVSNGFVNAHLTKAFACRKAPAALTRSGAPLGPWNNAASHTGAPGLAIPRAEESRSPNLESVSRDEAPTAAKQDGVGALSLTCARATAETLPKTSPREITSVGMTPDSDRSISRGEGQPRRQSTVQMTPGMPSDLDDARQLAGAGNLEEAAMVCQAHLHKRGPSAEAYYLLGLVRDASGDPQAVEYYRKALYLEPNHYETLLQMSLLLEKTGDPAGARIFKQRASRIAGQQTI